MRDLTTVFEGWGKSTKEEVLFCRIFKLKLDSGFPEVIN